MNPSVGVTSIAGRAQRAEHAAQASLGRKQTAGAIGQRLLHRRLGTASEGRVSGKPRAQALGTVGEMGERAEHAAQPS